MWTDFYWALLAGCALDLLLGDPAWLYHPVCIIGKYISWCEKKLRARGGDLRRSAVLLTASTVLITTAAAGAVGFLARAVGGGTPPVGMGRAGWVGGAGKRLGAEGRRGGKGAGSGVGKVSGAGGRRRGKGAGTRH